MGSTLRDHRYQIPLATRSTDISTMETCPGRFVLSLYHEHDEAHASFFALGTLLHEGIELAITHDLDQAYMCAVWLPDQVGMILKGWEASDRRVIETTKRGIDSLFDDAQRMMVNWFNHVHPDGDDRHPIYDDYEWPPQVEQTFERSAASAGTQYPVWGSVDALFRKPWPSSDPREWVIVDWKSGTQKQRSDFQLNFYRFGMGMGDTPAHFHHLDRVRKNAIVQQADPYPGDPEMARLITETEQIKLGILDGEIPEFTPSFLCPYCPVQEFCPVEGWPSKSRNRLKLRSMVSLAVPLEIVKRKVDNGA